MLDYIKKAIEDAKQGIIDNKVVEYTNYESKYVVLKPRVTVTVELTSGIVFKLDVTKYFEEVL